MLLTTGESGITPIPSGASIGSIILRFIAIGALLYLFVLAITMLGASFKLMGKEFAKSLFYATSNPVAGLAIGILATSIIQSSSTTTSIVVGLVGTGMLSFQAAIPMVMGANIGTSVTNTIVSLAHISRGDEFKRAFAGSTVHDFFNLCAVLVLLPLQMFYNIIGVSAHAMGSFVTGFGGLKYSSPLKAISKPVAKALIHFLGDNPWVSIVVAIVLLFIALRYIVKVLKSMVLSKVERFFQRYVFRTPALGFALGILVTVFVQSSSISTSVVVPLVGAGVITLAQIFPYTLGANIGTTVTSFLASFVIGTDEAVSVAFAHLIFNIYGISIFWPLKRIPIGLAERLSNLTQRFKLAPIVYIVVVFFVIPSLLLLLLD